MLGNVAHSEEMTMDEIKDIANFIKKSDGPNPGPHHTISLLGGEPTLHSNFKEIINYLLKDGFMIKLFSNGTFPRETADFLATVPVEAIAIILNINKKESYSPTQWANLQHNLTNLNKIIALGFTIFQVDFDYETVLDYIRKFDLKRDIRLGISMPIVGASNAYVTYPQYKLVAKRILKFADDSFKSDISFGFDCGFLLCMFTKKELGHLKMRNVNLNFVCDGAIDIGKDGRVWRCFPLYSLHNSKLNQFNTIVDLKEHYNKLLPVKVKGVSGSCGKCTHYKRGNCSGGCYGYEFQ